jgi:hypothetical protein
MGACDCVIGRVGSGAVSVFPCVHFRSPAQVGACDCVIGKIGYGTMSECLAHAKPLVFVRRDYFNEEPFLRKMLEARFGNSSHAPCSNSVAGCTSALRHTLEAYAKLAGNILVMVFW